MQGVGEEGWLGSSSKDPDTSEARMGNEAGRRWSLRDEEALRGIWLLETTVILLQQFHDTLAKCHAVSICSVVAWIGVSMLNCAHYEEGRAHSCRFQVLTLLLTAYSGHCGRQAAWWPDTTPPFLFFFLLRQDFLSPSWPQTLGNPPAFSKPSSKSWDYRVCHYRQPPNFFVFSRQGFSV